MEDDKKYKRMTEQLRMLHSDEDVANYIRWIIKGGMQMLSENKDTAKHDVKLCVNSCFYFPENEGQARTFRDTSTNHWYHENELVDIIGIDSVNKIKIR